MPPVVFTERREDIWGCNEATEPWRLGQRAFAAATSIPFAPFEVSTFALAKIISHRRSDLWKRDPNDAIRVAWAKKLAEDAPRSSGHAFLRALAFFTSLDHAGESIPPMSSNHEGGIVFSVQRGPRRWSLEIDDDGDLMIAEAGGERRPEWHEPASLDETVESLRRFRGNG